MGLRFNRSWLSLKTSARKRIGKAGMKQETRKPSRRVPGFLVQNEPLRFNRRDTRRPLHRSGAGPREKAPRSCRSREQESYALPLIKSPQRMVRPNGERENNIVHKKHRISPGDNAPLVSRRQN